IRGSYRPAMSSWGKWRTASNVKRFSNTVGIPRKRHPLSDCGEKAPVVAAETLINLECPLHPASPLAECSFTCCELPCRSRSYASMAYAVWRRKLPPPMLEAPLSLERVERRLTAILAADVAGYSRLMGGDEEGTLVQLKAHRSALVDPKITEHRGRIVKTTGDGVLVEFSSVVDAVRCAVDVQRGMAERNADVPQEKRIEFRIGINLGDIIIDGGDIFGDGVNVAARLEGIAEPGNICISDWQPKLFPVAIVPRPRQPLPPALDGIQECAAGSAHPGAGTRRGTTQPAAGARPEASSAAELNAPESCLKAQNSR